MRDAGGLFIKRLCEDLKPAQTTKGDPVEKLGIVIEYINKVYPEDDYLDMILSCVKHVLEVNEEEEINNFESLLCYIDFLEEGSASDEDD